jgi:hypothetical protein
MPLEGIKDELLEPLSMVVEELEALRGSGVDTGKAELTLMAALCLLYMRPTEGHYLAGQACRSAMGAPGRHTMGGASVVLLDSGEVIENFSFPATGGEWSSGQMPSDEDVLKTFRDVLNRRFRFREGKKDAQRG